MQRPSFREIPKGFGSPSVYRSLSVVAPSSANGPTIRCVVEAAGDRASLNAYGVLPGSLPANNWVGLALQLPVDLSQREPYFLSLNGLIAGAASGLVCVPFVGSCHAVGADVGVLVHDMLGFRSAALGSTASVSDFAGAVRASGVYEGVWPTSLFVVGMAFANFGAAQAPSFYRASITATRFNAPDYGVSVAVN